MSLPRSLRTRLRFGAYALLVLAGPVSAQVVTIGATGDCDYQWVAGGPPVVQLAVAAGAAEVRLTQDIQVSEAISIQGRSIRLIGGFASCHHAANNIAPVSRRLTPLRVPFDLARIFTLSNLAGGSIDIHLERLILTDPGSESRSPVDNGGAILAQGAMNLVLQDMEIIGTRARLRGGAVHVNDGVTLRTRLKTNIGAAQTLFSSVADAGGGGVYCRDSTVILGESTALYFNDAKANGSGGGMHANNCVVRILARSLPGPSIDFGFSSNTAGRHGGGIFAAENSRVYLLGGNDCLIGEICNDRRQPVRFSNNHAGAVAVGSGRGGAIALDGSRLSASQISLRANSAHQGGGLSAVNGSEVFILPPGFLDPDARGRLKDCWSTSRCNEVSDNWAGFQSSGGSGGAVFLIDSDAQLVNTRMEQNSGDLASVIDVDGLSWVEVSDSVITGNGRPDEPGTDDLTLFRVFGADTVFHLRNSTVAGNAVGNGVVGNNNAQITLTESIWHEQPSIALFPLPQLSNNQGECNVTSRPLPAGMASQVVVDPGFVDPAARDLRLRADSPAIDQCSHDELSGGAYDFVGQHRNVRLRPGTSTRMDAGAYESLDGERLFANGFYQAHD